MSNAVSGAEFGKRLCDAGLIPGNSRRIVIDIQSDRCVMIYYEIYADSKTLDVVVEELMKHPGKIVVKGVDESVSENVKPPEFESQ